MSEKETKQQQQQQQQTAGNQTQQNQQQQQQQQTQEQQQGNKNLTIEDIIKQIEEAKQKQQQAKAELEKDDNQSVDPDTLLEIVAEQQQKIEQLQQQLSKVQQYNNLSFVQQKIKEYNLPAETLELIDLKADTQTIMKRLDTLRKLFAKQNPVPSNSKSAAANEIKAGWEKLLNNLKQQ